MAAAALATAGLAALATSAQATTPSECDAATGNLVRNCGFETDNLTDWSDNSGGEDGVTSHGPWVHSGGYGADLGTIGHASTLAQTVAGTKPSTTYTFSYWMDNPYAGTPNSFEAQVSNVLGGPLTVESVTNAGALPWAQFIQTFTTLADGSAPTISFVARNDSYDFGVDDVVVAPSPYPAPAFTSAASTSFTHGTPASFTVSATPTAYARLCAYNSGQPLPAGLSFPQLCNSDPTGSHLTSGSSADLSFDGTTPGGQYTFSFYAVDDRNLGANFNSNQTVQSFTLTVYQAPAFGSADHATFTALHANSFQVAASGGYPTGPISYSEAGALPSGVSLNSSTGLLSGKPPVSAAGSWPITLTASNGHMSASQAFTLTVRIPAIPIPASAPAGGGLIQGVRIITTADSWVTWTASGYAPGAPVTLLAYPADTYRNPVTLDTFTADSSGNVTMTVQVPAGIGGIQYLVAGGYRTTGKVLYLTGQTDVRPPGWR